MKRIYYVPLENIEERYTPMFNNAFEGRVDKVLMPDYSYSKIETGQFLDVNKTSIFKAKQLQMIAEMFDAREVKNGDVFIVADIFFPGIESIRYLAELQDIKVEIFAFNHAGRSDEDDFVRKLSTWSDFSEEAYHRICDGVFFGSHFHLNRTWKYFGLDVTKLYNFGMIWDSKFVDNIFDSTANVKKIDRVVWPHRLSAEKGLGDLLIFAKLNPELDILVTSCGSRQDIKLPKNVSYKSNLTKAEYYEILATSKNYLSTAKQETFGYTLMEAIHFGCKIAVPNRASYPEMAPKECLYESIKKVQFYSVPRTWSDRFHNNIEDIIRTVNI